MSINNHIKTVCKIGQGDDCCRYLGLDRKGWTCMKFKPEMKKVVDDNWSSTPHVAQGDNCDGKEHLSKED